MKIVFIFSAFFILSIHASGTKIPTDTTQPRKPWKIPKQQFLNKYGSDDTAKAIINFYFARHKKSIKTVIALGPFAVLGSWFLVALVTNPYGQIAFLSVGIYIGAAVVLFDMSTLVSWYRIIKYPRKKLSKTLNNYFSGNGFLKS
jgi:hypothetical protein